MPRVFCAMTVLASAMMTSMKPWEAVDCSKRNGRHVVHPEGGAQELEPEGSSVALFVAASSPLLGERPCRTVRVRAACTAFILDDSLCPVREIWNAQSLSRADDIQPIDT